MDGFHYKKTAALLRAQSSRHCNGRNLAVITSGRKFVTQLIKPVELSKVKLGWLPDGLLAVSVKVEGVGTLIVRVTPLVFLYPTIKIAVSVAGYDRNSP